MTIEQVNFTGNTKQPKQKKQKYAGASLVSFAASQVLPISSLIAGIPVVDKMSKLSLSLAQDKIDIVNNAAEKVLKNNGLAEKGVKIFQTNIAINLTNIPDKIYELTNIYFGTARGKNAFFTNKDIGEVAANGIGINKNKLPLAVFHEIGHAHNYNFSKFWKGMQKLRMPGMLLGSVLGIFVALSKKSKPKEGNEELTKGQKIKDGIRNNAGKLAFLSFVPMLMEEGMASIKGCKFAKKELSEDLFKMVKKTNIVAYHSYAATAIITALAVFATRKIKDALVDKKEAKLQAELNAPNA